MVKIDNIEFSDLDVRNYLQKKGYRIENYSYDSKQSFGIGNSLTTWSSPRTIEIAINENETNETDKVKLEYKKVFIKLIENSKKNNLLK